MLMDDVLNKLRALQQILSEKIDLENQISDIPKMLSTQEELLARLKRAFIEKNSEYEKVRDKVNSLKGLLIEAEMNREKAEKNMDSITTQREYEALDKEIRESSEKEQLYRKELQKEEALFLELGEQQKRDTALIKQQEEELNEKKQHIEKELRDKTQEQKKLLEREKTITPGLDSDVLFKFERIIRSKHGLGIVAIKNGVCTGCHMILPAQFANKVRNGEEIIFCSYCSRILYYLESEQEEQDYFSDEDTGSLSDLDDLDIEYEEEYDEEDDSDQSEKSGVNYEE